MSGYICPDCKMFDIDLFTDESGEKKHRCKFCNWQGDPLPRIGLPLPQERAYRREQNTMKRQRKDNKLFFLRIYVKDPDTIIDDDDIWISLMEKLEIDTLDDPAYDPPYFFIKAKKRPSDRVIIYIKEIPGVLNITIY